MNRQRLHRQLHYLRLLFTWILISYLPLLPALFVSYPRQWYDALAKPPGVPPGWMFSVVWLSLYTLLGIASYLVWSRGLVSGFRREAIVFFLAQLFFNALFSPVFFGLQSLTGGVIVLVILLVLTSITGFYFWIISKQAGLIIILYLSWLCYAFYLNLSIWLLNTPPIFS